jgi:hypothetical protein
MSRPAVHVSALELRFLVLDGRRDWPVVQILIDGREAFVDRLPGWQGFDPAKMLGSSSPLLPQYPGCRIAVYRCSCGIEGCGVVAPLIVRPPGSNRVSWVDFRDYTGVFTGPALSDDDDGDGGEGTPWDFQDVHFDLHQYLGEIARASADRSWETPGRVTARLVEGRLRAAKVVLPQGLILDWAMPAPYADGVMISFQNKPDSGTIFAQQILILASDHSEPGRAADDILGKLQQFPVTEWVSHFGWQPPRG